MEVNVNHIAKLARLGLAEGEEKKFAKELSSILDFVAKLRQAPTAGVEPTAQVTGTTNVFRDDEEDPISQGRHSKERILKNAPSSTGGFFKVKRVLE